MSSGGQWERVTTERPHECRPPGAWARWWHRAREGSVWRCDCGRRWEWGVGPLGVWPGWMPLDQPHTEVLDDLLGPPDPSLRDRRL